MLAPWKKSYDKPRECFKKQRYHFADKGPHSQSYGFSSNHVCISELDKKEGWVPKNGCFWVVVLQKTLQSPVSCRKIKLVNPKGNQPWLFTGRTDAEVEAPITWPTDVNANSLEKTLMLRIIKGKRRCGWPWMRWLDSITDSMVISLSNSGS